VWSDDAFKFEFSNMSKATLRLDVYSGGEEDKVLYYWEQPLSYMAGTTGWIDLIATVSSGVVKVEDSEEGNDKPQLNVAIRLNYVAAPLHLTMLRPYLKKRENPGRFRDGDNTIITPSDSVLNQWMPAVEQRQSNVGAVLRLLLVLLLMVAFFVLPGVFLFVYLSPP
jgi:hypothetical protein